MANKEGSSSSSSSASLTSFMFRKNEIVFLLHRTVMYEGKCLKRIRKDGENFYLIHYRNWSKHYDQWLHEDRLFKNTEITRDLFKKMNKNYKCNGNLERK